QLLTGGGILTGYCQQTRPDTVPWGLEGGEDGKPAVMVHNPGTDREKNLKSKMVGMTLERGDVLRLVGAGGGGWGDPATRDAVLTDRDRVEGYA
ncbi:MAG: hydantoinase B/oxoprolinase family protein, partial [Rhodospirillaceae bacterium]|nr:hydantoinase B/oxoprolinase family protein [Rhodospirillaceae bacterium]